MDVVLDSNVWVSGLLWRGAPWQILRRVAAGDVTLWATPSIIQEVQQTLNYPRLQPRRVKLNLEIIDLISYALTLMSLVERADVPRVVADDPDDVFVACAVHVGASYLVSGDRHLLVIGQHQNVMIVQPHVFLGSAFPQDQPSTPEFLR